MKSIVIRFTGKKEHLYETLKTLSLDEGTSINYLVTEAVKNYLKNKQKQNEKLKTS